ncbi:MAG: hypothetical protein E3K37_00310 [Candidatus Kuenenia sp.]|nr:hypothetical protein [Candidatus Kuenenia hertensis]
MVNLFANKTSGVSPLEVAFAVDTQISNQIILYEIDYKGNGANEIIADPDNISFVYNQEGIYYPTITVTDNQGNLYTDTVAITILSLNEMDAYFKEKWEGLITYFINNDVEGALALFDDRFCEVYREQFTDLSSVLNTIGNELGYIRFVDIGDNRDEYEIIVTREEITYSYYLLFVKDQDGLWKIKAF